MRVYISGKMSGLSETQIYEHFGNAEQRLKAQGYKVFNPARWIWFLKYFPYRFALTFDLFMMCFCQRVYMLKGWSYSKGATIEYQFARVNEIEIDYE